MPNLLIIKDILRQKGIKTESFCEEMDMSRQAYNKLMRNNSTNLGTLILIAQKLKVSVCVFFTDIELRKNEGNELNYVTESKTESKMDLFKELNYWKKQSELKDKSLMVAYKTIDELTEKINNYELKERKQAD